STGLDRGKKTATKQLPRSGLVQQEFWNRPGCPGGPCAPDSGPAHPISAFAHLIPALRTLSGLRLVILAGPCAAGQGKTTRHGPFRRQSRRTAEQLRRVD